MKIVIEGDNLFWLFIYYGITFPALFYSAGKFGDWLSRKIIRWVEKK